MPLSADELSALADAALDAAAGCQAAELRVERIRSQTVRLRDALPETTADDTDFGMGVRVVVDGAVGFAASVDVRPEEAANLVHQARQMAALTNQAGGGRVELAPEPSHGPVGWSSAFEVDPATVSMADKTGLLAEWSARLGRHNAVSHTSAALLSVSEHTFLADLNGTRATQHRVRLQCQLEALALSGQRLRDDADPGAPGRPRLGVPHRPGRNGTWDWDAELAELPELLAEKLASPSVEAGRYDLVVDPSNLWLAIHESIGHATELDRAVGYEAAYAGTSFATFDKVGTLAYGSPVMHVTGDRTVDHGLATVAIDDEGVEGQSFDLVRDGILVGYQLDRGIAAAMGYSAPTAAPSPTPRCTCRFNAWPTSRSPTPARAARARTTSLPGSSGGSTSWATRAGRSTCSATTPSSRATLLSHRGRTAGRPAARRRLPGHHDRLLGRHGGGRGRVDLGARRRLQLWEGPARPGGTGLARVPVGPGTRGQRAQHREEAGR